MSQTSGIYRLGGASGVITAGMSSAGNIFSFRWANAQAQALIRRVQISAGDTATAFTAGTFLFNLFVARAFTASDSSGTSLTPTGNTCKLDTRFAPSLVTDVRIANTDKLTAGTRTLDGQAIGSITSSDPATAGNPILSNADLFYAAPNEQPLVLAPNEGFVIQGTVPATGTWSFSAIVQWEEGTGF